MTSASEYKVEQYHLPRLGRNGPVNIARWDKYIVLRLQSDISLRLKMLTPNFFASYIILVCACARISEYSGIPIQISGQNRSIGSCMLSIKMVISTIMLQYFVHEELVHFVLSDLTFAIFGVFHHLSPSFSYYKCYTNNNKNNTASHSFTVQYVSH